MTKFFPITQFHLFKVYRTPSLWCDGVHLVLQLMLSESMLRMEKEDASNPMTDDDDPDGVSVSQLPMQPIRESGGSSAYRLSLQRNQSKRAELAAKGLGDKSYEYKEYDPEDNSEVVHLPEDVISHLPPAEKLRLIGRKTVCMAVVLTCFGLAMMITSFFFIRKHLNDSGFLLFFLIGFCALLPGLYASYNIIGKYMGWKGFDHSLPSYDRRVI